MMKKKNSWIENLILALLALVILLPILTLLIWTFTERWAWPDLIPIFCESFAGNTAPEGESYKDICVEYFDFYGGRGTFGDHWAYDGQGIGVLRFCR